MSLIFRNRFWGICVLFWGVEYSRWKAQVVMLKNYILLWLNIRLLLNTPLTINLMHTTPIYFFCVQPKTKKEKKWRRLPDDNWIFGSEKGTEYIFWRHTHTVAKLTFWFQIFFSKLQIFLIFCLLTKNFEFSKILVITKKAILSQCVTQNPHLYWIFANYYIKLHSAVMTREKKMVPFLGFLDY